MPTPNTQNSTEGSFADTIANQAAVARGENPNPLVDSAKADKFNQVEGKTQGELADAFAKRPERAKAMAGKFNQTERIFSGAEGLLADQFEIESNRDKIRTVARDVTAKRKKKSSGNERVA